MNLHSTQFSRRDALRFIAVAGVASLRPGNLFGESARPPAPAASRVTAYLETLRRPDGGYGWSDQATSHLTPTFGAIGAYRVLKVMPPNREELAGFVRTHHPQELKRLQQEARIFDWQQVQALRWLGADAAEFATTVSAFTQPVEYIRLYESHGYPVAQSELSAVLSHALLGLPVAGIAESFGRYLDERRRPNGSYNNTPAADGGDGHVMTTLLALQASRALGRAESSTGALIAWLHSCQLPNGGFTFQPEPTFGGVDDIAYVSAAVRALQWLGAEPIHREACVAYIHSLANADGGFGDRPGWLSNATATHRALDALDALGSLGTISGLKPRLPRSRTGLPSGLKIYSAQLEAHGTGSPADAVELARSLKIDLWGAKSAQPGWGARFAEVAAERKVPVTWFSSDEEHGTWLQVPGFGTYSHISDVIAPAGVDFGAPLGTRHAAGPPVSWEEYRERRLKPLHRANGRLIWQFGENEQLMRLLLDDSVGRGGYAAISTYHFGNPDFTNSEPFLNRWRGRIPFVALLDSHGAEPWYFADFTTGFRTLFLAAEPTWDGWIKALDRNWTVPVRHDALSKGKTWMHSGSDEVLEFVRAREKEWRWWNNPQCERPLVSIVAVGPDDEFESDRPAEGVNIRVRCAWECSYLGALQKPLAELVRLSIDGKEVTTTLVERKRTNTQAGEHAHYFALSPKQAEQAHAVTAVVREIATNREIAHPVVIPGRRTIAGPRSVRL